MGGRAWKEATQNDRTGYKRIISTTLGAAAGAGIGGALGLFTADITEGVGAVWDKVTGTWNAIVSLPTTAGEVASQAAGAVGKVAKTAVETTVEAMVSTPEELGPAALNHYACMGGCHGFDAAATLPVPVEQAAGPLMDQIGAHLPKMSSFPPMDAYLGLSPD